MFDKLIVIVAQYAVVLLPIIVVFVALRLDKQSRIRYVVTLILGGILGLVGVFIASHLINDPRPFLTSGVVPLFHHAPDNGFPSDHTTFSIILAGITLFFSRKIGIAMLFLAVAIGSARVLAHVHSWLDIAGGIIVGAIVVALSLWLGSYFVKNQHQHSNTPALGEKE